MIFVHGWPGSFLEARKKIQPLNSPPSENDQAFRLVVLSLPGYGSGPPPTKPTFGPATTARAFKTLMVDTLGYGQFVAQGGTGEVPSRAA